LGAAPDSAAVLDEAESGEPEEVEESEGDELGLRLERLDFPERLEWSGPADVPADDAAVGAADGAPLEGAAPSAGSGSVAAGWALEFRGAFGLAFAEVSAGFLSVGRGVAPSVPSVAPDSFSGGRSPAAADASLAPDSSRTFGPAVGGPSDCFSVWPDLSDFS
jgi:hypothetical protein